MSDPPTISSTNVITLNVSALMNISTTSSVNCVHMQTKEVKHPLTAPGGFVLDPLTLLHQDHLNTLTSGRTCEFCNQPATGFSSFSHNHTPWIDLANTIQGRNTLPLRAYFPFSLMNVGILAGPFARNDQAATSDTNTEDGMVFSECLKKYGFYTPNQNCIVVPTCKKPVCNVQGKQTIETLEAQIGLTPELPLFVQPFTTALGNVVCQYCGDTNIKMCKKDGKYCGFGYCSKEHQIADWSNHKKACKHRRLSDQPPPCDDKRLIFDHTFVGDPMDKLTYFVYPKQINLQLLDTSSPYFHGHFQDFARSLERSRKITLQGTATEKFQCVICKNQSAIRCAGFQSIPITSKDEPNSNKLNYYKAMLHLYSEAGAFPAETFEDVWKQFNEERARTAQMVSLQIPVCDQEVCLKKTTALHHRSVMKLILDVRGEVDPSGMYLTTVF